MESEFGSQGNPQRDSALNGRALGLKVIAEGIEDTRTAEILRDINCDIGQGFLFGPAKNASEIDTGQTRTLSFG